MACQPSLWSALPPDIGSEQHPRPCRAIEGGLSSRKITVKKAPKKTQRGPALSVGRLGARVKPGLQLGRGMACNAMHMVRGCPTEACCRSGAMNGCWSWSWAVPTRASCSEKCVFRLGALEKAQPIKDGLVSTVVLHPRCAVDALEGLGGCWGHVLIGRD